MRQHYAEIDFSQIQETKNYTSIPGGRCIAELGPVNLLVGPNNAGKSRFLRALFRAENFIYRPSGKQPRELIPDVKKFDDLVDRELSGDITGYDSFRRDTFNQYTNLEWFQEGEDLLEELRKKLRLFINIDFKNTDVNPTYTNTGSPAPSQDEARAHEERTRKVQIIHGQLLSEAKRLEALVAGDPLEVGGEPRIYIPVLRGLRPLGEDDLYERRTRKDYGITDTKKQVFTGLTMYEGLRNLLLGSRDGRQSVKNYEDFLSKELFDNKPVELTPRREEDVVYLRVGNNEERPIYKLGDGLQQLIIITFPAFTATKRTLLFIEEPETHLHPGMQRKLLELFLRHPELQRHQLFLTTHSNHLLDMAADYSGCATLLFRESSAAESCEIRVMGQKDRMVLDDLGVRASSVFLTNATIWVEGISDRLYLREYLRKYLSPNKETSPPLKEDTHYSFMESGGSNVVHYNFAQESAELLEKIRVARICSQSFVVLDGDNQGKPRLQELQVALKNNLFVLKSKEVENLLPVEVLRAYVAYVFEQLKRKVDTRSLNLEDYHQKAVPLGKVLDEKFRTKVFTKGRTIKKKDGVLRFCVDFMREHPDKWVLTPEADQLCQQLVHFIRVANNFPDAAEKPTGASPNEPETR